MRPFTLLVKLEKYDETKLVKSGKLLLMEVI